MNKKKVIGKLEEELNNKENEIKEKENIINTMKHTFKSSDDDDEDHDISGVLKADGDADSTFDFAQLDLDIKEVIQDVKENVNETKEKDLQCKQCGYKCKRTKTLKKHINTKHGA